MALEPVWKDQAVVLVSDGGGTFDFKPDQGPLAAFKRLGRYTPIQGRQAGAVLAPTSIRRQWHITLTDDEGRERHG